MSKGPDCPASLGCELFYPTTAGSAVSAPGVYLQHPPVGQFQAKS